MSISEKLTLRILGLIKIFFSERKSTCKKVFQVDQVVAEIHTVGLLKITTRWQTQI